MFGSPPKASNGSVEQWIQALAPFADRTLKVIWDVSNKCNLRCRMCHFSHDEVFYRAAQYTSPAMFERIAAQALPIAHTLILSASNEPLMSPHFAEILEIAARYGVPDILFLTNGQLLSRRIAEAVIESGVTQVQISIDGATKETYESIRRGARFERLLRNLEFLSERKRQLGRARPRLQFNIVLMRKNLEELPLFVDLAEKLGVEWIAARHLLMMDGLGMEEETLARDPAEANLHFQRFFRRVEESKTVTVIEFPDFFNSAELTPASFALAAIDTNAMATTPGEPVVAGPAIEKPFPSIPARHSIMGKIIREIRRIPRNFCRAFGRRRPSPPARPKTKKFAALPFGSVDRPPQGSDTQTNNAIELAGWALDRIQIARVTIEREPLPIDSALNGRGLVELGEARLLNGSRPDVGVVFPLYPHLHRAGWSFELQREMISTAEKFQAVIHVIAHGVDGRSAEIGQREIGFSRGPSAKPYLFCSKPFDSLFIDSRGDVRPYPDCRPVKPFGSLTEDGASLRSIWFGEDFGELRRRIIERDPPPMCLTCAYFINRNVDDPQYFIPR